MAPTATCWARSTLVRCSRSPTRRLRRSPAAWRSGCARNWRWRAREMDPLPLALFLIAAFLGGLTTGLSGFAMGLVVSGIWLHLITPSQNALLIVLCGIVTQGMGIWRVRHAIKWKAVVPFIAGSAVGVAFGTLLLKTV